MDAQDQSTRSSREDSTRLVVVNPSKNSKRYLEDHLVSSSPPARDKDDASTKRKMAAIMALDSSVRAGQAYYNTPNGNGGSSLEIEANCSEVGDSGCPPAACRFIDATQQVGSFLYMAPEVLLGAEYNEKVDVFSFGIIMFELFSGYLIFSRTAVKGDEAETLEYAKQVAEGHRESFPGFFPPGLRALIASCWAQDPNERPSFADVLRALVEIKTSGVVEHMDKARPRGSYDPVNDCGCGCTIM